MWLTLTWRPFPQSSKSQTRTGEPLRTDCAGGFLRRKYCADTILRRYTKEETYVYHRSCRRRRRSEKNHHTKNDWESIGFQVVGEAENGVEALELVTKNEPDLLLTGYPHAVHIGAGAGEAGAGGASVHADRIFKRI